MDETVKLIEIERGWSSSTHEPRYFVAIFFDDYKEMLFLEVIYNECNWCIHNLEIQDNIYKKE